MSKTGGGRATNQYRVQGVGKSAESIASGQELREATRLAALVDTDTGYGATEVDEDVREFLTPRRSALLTLAEVNEHEAENILLAVNWLESHPYSSTSDLLDVMSIREIHKRMFEDVWTWAGKFRSKETNIGVAPHLVTTHLAVLLRNTQEQIDAEAFPAGEVCVRFHHALVSIHCFPNGNGRHARVAADELGRLLGLGHRPLTWGSKTGLPASERRRRYLQALRTADATGQFDELLKIAFS
ncbi:MAG: mobile mystery protein B [Actinomycetota bacterium]|nr:mobile mystery protein B [Actinomycetota bacterium]